MTVEETDEDLGKFPLAPRGSKIGPVPPEFGFSLNNNTEVWSDNLPTLLEEARAVRWNGTDLPWRSVKPLNEELELSLCQLLTFLVQNEYLSLYLASKFVSRITPYLGEVSLLLSYNVRDEANHIDVITRRANLASGFQKVSSATQYALKSVLELEDFSAAVFVLYVMGDASIADLLSFLTETLRDDFTREMFGRIASDESRHVSYGIAKTKYRLARNANFLNSIRRIIEEKASYFFEVAAVDEVVKQSILKLVTVDVEEHAAGEAKLKQMYSTIENGRRTRLLQILADNKAVDEMMGTISLSGSGLC